MVLGRITCVILEWGVTNEKAFRSLRSLAGFSVLVAFENFILSNRQDYWRDPGVGGYK
jgi:hypothetical protein